MQWTLNNVIALYVMVVTSLLMSRRSLGDKMDQATQDYILKVHNDYRAKEGASNMPKLVWNQTLEAEADAWAQRCNFQHKGMGENLAWNSKVDGQETDLIDNAMKKFYDEKQMYSYGRQSCGPMSCHYTQVSSSIHPSIRPGNWDGQKPFEKGAACSACANDNAQCENGLCVGGQAKIVKVECKDDRKECPEWVTNGECQNNESFMSKSCKASCNKC
ncbi:hypothetical protein ACOMHN_025178 [Nucella lapillus]